MSEVGRSVIYIVEQSVKVFSSNVNTFFSQQRKPDKAKTRRFPTEPVSNALLRFQVNKVD